MAAPRLEAAESSSWPADQTGTDQTGNLPADITVFVGRRRELSEVRRLLASTRLVTLTGTGGVGKTRLALRVGASCRRAFRHGTWLIELGEVQDHDLVPQTVATALGLQDRASQPGNSLAEYLRDKQLLLILDNCEHLLDPCARLVERLLRVAPDLVVLATGREPLGLTGEVIYQVPPLSLPAPHRPLPELEALAHYESVSLFVELASRVQPGFEVTLENRDAVVQLCRRLDGMPLAIELTAARLRYLSVDQLVRRLDRRYQLLTGSRAASARHQTLEALFDWSYDLCTVPERTAWARLSTFVGAFDLDAARHVCADEGIEPDEIEDLVGELVAKSILLVDNERPHPRYHLLETVRAYGSGRLSAADRRAVQRRHRDYYQALVAEAQRRLFTADQSTWQAHLRAEHANIRAALDFCVTEPGEADAGLAIASALWQYWVASGSVTEGEHWLDRLLALSPAPSALRAKSLWVRAWLAILQSQTTTATANLAESAELGEKLADRTTLGYVSLFSGILATLQDDLSRATSLYEEALSHHRAANEPIGVAMALYRNALIAFLNGDDAAVHEACGACRSLCDAHHEKWWKAYALWVEGLQFWRNGDMRSAGTAGTEALELFRQLDDKLGTAMSLEAFAWMAAGNHAEGERAATLLGAAGTLWQTLGPPLAEFAYLRDYHRECEQRAYRSCGAETFRSAFRHGGDLGGADAIDLALRKRDQHEQPENATHDDTERLAMLTPREREIALLLTEGLSNREIARRLVISSRTAEAHIEHILTKLGFTSRTQVAAWATTRSRGDDR